MLVYPRRFQSHRPAKFSDQRRACHSRRKFRSGDYALGRGYLQMMIEARVRGFEIVLVYIGTESVEINLARIRDRVLAGGHNVPEPDVRRRFTRSFQNLPLAIQRADHTILFDNSTEEGYRLVAILGSSENQWLKPVPRWAATLSSKR